MKRYIPDVLAVIGVSLVSYGAWLSYPPLGFVIAGGFLIFVGSRVAGK